MYARSASNRQNSSRTIVHVPSSQTHVHSSRQTDTIQSADVQSDTACHGPRDHLAIRYCDQGWPPPIELAIDTTHLSLDCPFHGLVMLDTQSQRSHGMMATDSMVSNMPPTALTQSIRLGTALSCGCTCGKVKRDDLQDFTIDIDASSRSSGNPLQTTAQRSSN